MTFRLTSPLLWLAVLIFWTVFGVASAAQIYVRESASGLAKSPRDVVNIVYFYWAWAVVTPFILRAAERLFEKSVPFGRRIIEHVPVVFAVFAAQASLYALFAVMDNRTPLALLGNRAL